MVQMALGSGVPAAGDAPVPARRLFRKVVAGHGQGVADVFASLGSGGDSQLIAENPGRGTQAARMTVRPEDGHGHYEFYRISSQFFVVTLDCIYDAPRLEMLPGEDLIEFYVKLSGRLSLKLPGEPEDLVVNGPQLLIWAQPRGVDTSECMDPGLREYSVSLYCRQEFLRSLLTRDSMTAHPLLKALDTRRGDRVWHCVRQLSPTAMHLSRCLLRNPYRDGLRLLHAEARSLELLCEILSEFGDESQTCSPVASDRDQRRLDAARRILTTQFQPTPRIRDVARAVGLSESKLKQDFKQRFGITVFDYGHECRMRHARELLLTKGLSVGEAAHAIGYRHHASFTAAFREFYGSLPSEVGGERGGQGPL